MALHPGHIRNILHDLLLMLLLVFLLTSGKCRRDISVRPTEITGPVKVDHLQSWSREFSDRTKSKWSVPFSCPFDVPTEISGILG